MQRKTTKPILLRPYFLSLALGWTGLVAVLILFRDWDHQRAAHGLLWLAGMTGLGLFGRRLEARIEERERAQSALWKSQDRVRAMVEAMEDWVWEIDSAGRYTFVGSRVRDILGHEPADLLGRSPADLAAPHASARMTGEIADLLREKPGFWAIETTHMHKRGHEVEIESRAVPFFDPQGAFLGYRGIDRDITRRKREQAELEEYRHRLESQIEQRTARLMEANRALQQEIAERMRMGAVIERTNLELQQKSAEMEQFVYTVSHDLKSPLVTIHGFAVRVEEDARVGRLERVPDSTARIQRAARRMMGLIDDLLELSRVGRITNASEEVDVGAIVREWLADHDAELAARDVQVGVAAEFPRLLADPVRIRQIFENLLGNALRHGVGRHPWDGGRTPAIECGWEHHEGEVWFYVRDNGPGICAEHHEKIFELFHRLVNHTPGTGVGLTIVRRIAELHGGRAWVASQPGEGATFWVALPRAVLVPAAA